MSSSYHISIPQGGLVVIYEELVGKRAVPNVLIKVSNTLVFDYFQLRVFSYDFGYIQIL